MNPTMPALTPISMLERSADVFRHNVAILDGDLSFTYAEFAERSRRFAGLLAAHGVQPGDRVAALCSNSHVLLELHNAVPMLGAVLVALNTRLSPAELDYILKQSSAVALVATPELAGLVGRLSLDGVIVIAGDAHDQQFEAAIANADPITARHGDDLDLLAINYTSGTTGRPKGVMYHHRGAYLQALAMAYHADLRPHSQYLWTLPMFHCNGWCYTWAVTAAGGTHVCMRHLNTGEIWDRLRSGVTHLSAAPTVLTMISEDPAARPLAQRVRVGTGGAPPSPTLLDRMHQLNFEVTQLYGLTETFGPVVINQWQPRLARLTGAAAAAAAARQGVATVIGTRVRVLDEHDGDVPEDGESMGEIAIKGNTVMLGYYRDDEATRQALRGGWFRTGDLAVVHPDGYLEIRDRSKDIIISGGENIASVEVERMIDSYPEVIECAVVGLPDEKWGQVPVAFVRVRHEEDFDPDDLIRFLKERLAGYKVPRRYVVGDLPRTSTGKIKKGALRRGSDAPAI